MSGWPSGGLIGAKRAAGAQRPRGGMLATGARVHAERAPPLLIERMHQDLQIGRWLLRQRQDGMQDQLIDHRAAGQLARPQDHLDEPGRREHHGVVDLMADQPTLGAE